MDMETEKEKDWKRDMGIAFFLGALSMLDVMFRNQIDDRDLHRRYVLELCESSAPALTPEQASEYVIGKIHSSSSEWVAEYYRVRMLAS